MLTMRRARGVHFAADEPLVHVPCSHEGTVMDVFRPAVRIGGSAEPSGLAADPRAAEAEVAMLRAQVAWLRAERAALWWAVGHDELTGLANRRLFATLAPRLLRTGQPAAVIVLDLNGFKPINDTLGHEAGDQVLQIVAHRIASCVRDDLVARLGGDEFTAVLISPHRRPHAQWWRPAVTALSAAIAEPMPVAGRILTVTASIGVAPAHGDVLLTDLLHRADLAMYHAKVSGGQYAAWGRQVAVPEVVAEAIESAHAPFDLAAGPLLRSTLWRLAADEHRREVAGAQLHAADHAVAALPDLHGRRLAADRAPLHVVLRRPGVRTLVVRAGVDQQVDLFGRVPGPVHRPEPGDEEAVCPHRYSMAWPAGR